MEVLQIREDSVVGATLRVYMALENLNSWTAKTYFHKDDITETRIYHFRQDLIKKLTKNLRLRKELENNKEDEVLRVEISKDKLWGRFDIMGHSEDKMEGTKYYTYSIPFEPHKIDLEKQK
jgi:D-hexose-6-phosphate mutarotase